jgi:hypothetical protein
VTYVLQSYSEDRWQSGGGDAKPLLDASTGEEVARIASSCHTATWTRQSTRPAVAEAAWPDQSLLPTATSLDA